MIFRNRSTGHIGSRISCDFDSRRNFTKRKAPCRTMGREAKFDEHFVPKRNIIHERARFHHRNQKQGVSVESFVRSLSNGGNSVRGPGYWTMNTSLLDDDEYIKDVTAQMPSWLTEGRKELSDNRSICHWLKYNIRVHAIQIQIRVHAIQSPNQADQSKAKI